MKLTKIVLKTKNHLLAIGVKGNAIVTIDAQLFSKNEQAGNTIFLARRVVQSVPAT